MAHTFYCFSTLYVYRKIPRISYKDHVTKEDFYAKALQAIGPHENLLTRCFTQVIHGLAWTVR